MSEHQCPECHGKTILFRDSGGYTAWRICPQYKRPGHRSMDECLRVRTHATVQLRPFAVTYRGEDFTDWRCGRYEKLTPAQRDLLACVADGGVWADVQARYVARRPGRSAALKESFAWRYVLRLQALGLIEWPKRHRDKPLSITESGRAALLDGRA